VNSKDRGVKRTLYVHRLVAEAFLGKPADANEVNHIDGNKENNNLDNLEWTTHSANLQHAYKEGLHPNRSLTPEQVRQARAKLATGQSLRQVAAEFGVSRSAINHLKQGRSWAWLADSAA
jgi:DNA-directed RNA polymerase sigma subunit (sigma70/sigma32)